MRPKNIPINFSQVPRNTKLRADLTGRKKGCDGI
jgi:hypothetical protein